jgi:hypothetical protein
MFDPSGNVGIGDVVAETVLIENLTLLPQVRAGGIFKEVHGFAHPHGIFLQGHYLHLGNLNLIYSHAFLRITPTDQDAWRTPLPSFFEKRDQYGDYFATIGAGPSNIFAGQLFVGAHLIEGIDRPTDVSDPVWFSVKLSVPENQENDVIGNLLRCYSGYQNNLDYGLIPAQAPGSYNSNSYVSGLLDAAGVTKPPYITNDSFPGWDQPVPTSAFGH